MSLNIADVREYTLEELSSLLAESTAKGEQVVLSVPIGTVTELEDLAMDLLAASFVGETIAAYCTEIICGESHYKRYTYIPFGFHPQDSTGLAEKLMWLSPMFTIDGSTTDGDWEADFGDDESDEDYEMLYGPGGVRLAFDDFRDNLEHRELHLPRLADEYMAVHVTILDGRGEELAQALADGQLDHFRNEVGADVVEELLKYPERGYGFRRLLEARGSKATFYASNTAWIVPLGTDVQSLLQQYGGYDEGGRAFDEAKVFSVENIPDMRYVVFSEAAIARYPADEIAKIQQSAKAFLHRHPGSTYIDGTEARVVLEDSEDHGNSMKLFLSRERDLLIACDSMAQYVLFRILLRFWREDAKVCLSASGIPAEVRSLLQVLKLPERTIDNLERLDYGERLL